MSRIEQSYFFYSGAAKYLDTTLEEFRYLVAEGYIRYGIDMRGNPDNCVSTKAAEDYFERGKHPEAGDVCHDQFVYIDHSDFYALGKSGVTWNNQSNGYDVFEFQDFSGNLHRIFEIEGDGSLSGKDIYSCQNILLKPDDDGLLLAIRFTKEELDRYRNKDEFQGPEQKFEGGLERFIQKVNNVSFDVAPDWCMYRKAERRGKLALFLWRALNLFFYYHGSDRTQPTASELIEFMKDYSDLVTKHRHWRLEIHFDGKEKRYSFEPETLGSRQQFVLKSIEQSLGGLQQYRKTPVK
jgi:hypothetical protein